MTVSETKIDFLGEMVGLDDLIKRIEEMCADSWNWQKKNPDGYHTAN